MFSRMINLSWFCKKFFQHIDIKFYTSATTATPTQNVFILNWQVIMRLEVLIVNEEVKSNIKPIFLPVSGCVHEKFQ